MTNAKDKPCATRFVSAVESPIVRDNVEDATLDRLAFGYGFYQEPPCEIFAERDPGRLQLEKPVDLDPAADDIARAEGL